MTDPNEWTFSDGWILMSIFLTHGDTGAQLDDIVRAADALNHAIPTSEELSGSLTRLVTCGIVTVHDDRFQIAAELLPLIERAKQGKGGLFSFPEKARKWLSGMKFLADNAVRITIANEQVAAAYERYVELLRAR